MHFRTILSLAALSLLLAACGTDVRDLTLEEWDRLDRIEKQERVRELGEEDAALLMMGALAIGFSGDTTAAKSMTVGEVIERGREAREKEKSAP